MQLILLTAEGDADEALTIAAEDKAGGEEDVCFVEHLLSQLLYVSIVVGYASPQEHSYLILVVAAAQRLHDFAGQLAAVAVVAVVALVPIGFTLQGSSCGQLHGAEHTAVDVALYFKHPLYELRIGGQHTDTPTWHVVTLTH